MLVTRSTFSSALLLLALLCAASSQALATNSQTTHGQGVSGGPSPLVLGKPTAAPLTRSHKVMSQGETIDNFEGDYPSWAGEQAIDATRTTTVIARDEDEWNALWMRVGQSPPITLPKKRHAIGILLGPRDTVGYHVRVTDMRKVGEGLHIIYLESKPAPSESGSRKEEPTSPWFIKLIPEVPGTIRFFPTGR